MTQAELERVPLAAAIARLRAGWASALVAGRLVHQGADWWLLDQSGEARIAPPPFAAGDLVAGALSAAGSSTAAPFVLRDVRLLAQRRAPPCAADRGLLLRFALLEQRAAIVRAVREFFHQRGFLEVETPARVRCPGLEPHLAPIAAGAGRWLITSPELHLKRLLAAGVERVVEIARVWRDDEAGSWHLGEFAMLEWYRAHGDLDDIAADVCELLAATAEAAGVDPTDVSGCDVTLAPERVTVRQAFQRFAALDLAALQDREALASAVRRLGLHCAADDDWDELFFRVLVEVVEPHLGRTRVTALEDYPSSQAALARIRPDPDWPVALRREFYVAGVELANAFDELTDPDEQRRRHEADRERRRGRGRAVPDLDPEFLAALEAGAPPAAGVALGLDRLVALVLGETELAAVVAFPNG